jgi:hypothetical protein
MKFAPRTVERSATMEAQILTALKAGPLRMPALTALFGIENTHAGRQVINRRLAALRRRKKVRRIGARDWSAWALMAYHGKVAPPAHIGRFQGKIKPAAPTESWWLVPEQQFADAHRERSLVKRWESADTLVDTPDG